MATESISSIRSSGGDYTSLTSWEAGEQADIVTADEIAIAECYDDWPSGLADSLTIDGWTTDATRYIIVRAASGEGHTGESGTGFWMTSSSSTSTIVNKESYTRIQDLEANKPSSAGGNVIRELGGNSLIERCILTGDGTGPAFQFGANDSVFRNNLVICSTNEVGAYRNASISGSECLNCTIINTSGSSTLAGIDYNQTGDNASDIVKNCVVAGFNKDGVFNSNNVREYNATDQANDSDSGFYGKTGSVFGVVTTDGVDFTEPSTGDYSVVSGGKLHEAGTNLSSEGFSDDVLGNTRS